MKRPRSYRETVTDNHKALDYYAALAGVKPVPRAIDLPAKRERVKSAVPTESQEQIAFVRWFRLQYPGVRIFAIPNGGARDAITGAILRAEGVEPGVPDLMIPAWKLFIEFKRVKGSATSDEQKEWAAYLVEHGYAHFYAFGCEDAIKKVRLPISHFVDETFDILGD